MSLYVYIVGEFICIYVCMYVCIRYKVIYVYICIYTYIALNLRRFVSFSTVTPQTEKFQTLLVMSLYACIHTYIHTWSKLFFELRAKTDVLMHTQIPTYTHKYMCTYMQDLSYF